MVRISSSPAAVPSAESLHGAAARPCDGYMRVVHDVANDEDVLAMSFGASTCAFIATATVPR